MLRQLNHPVVVRAVALIVAFAPVSGCTLNTDVSEPGALIRYGGDNQTAAVNTPLASPIQVLVVNQLGERLKNVTVNWSIAAGGGTLSASATQSDDSGIAEVNYTTGPAPGTAIIIAKISAPFALSFTVTITP